MKYLQKKIRVALVAALALCVYNFESTQAFQSRFYDIKKDNAQCTEIRKFLEAADQRIRVNGYTFLTMSLVGPDGVKHENLSWPQVQKILEFEPRRNTLSIFFESPYGLFIPMPSMKEYVRGCKEHVKAFKPGLDKLGFNRILVTTEDIHYYNSPFKGYFVLADIRDPKMEQLQMSAAPGSTNESDVEERKKAAEYLNAHGLKNVDWQEHTLESMRSKEAEMSISNRLKQMGVELDSSHKTLPQLLEIQARVDQANRLHQKGVNVDWQSKSLGELYELEDRH